MKHAADTVNTANAVSSADAVSADDTVNAAANKDVRLTRLAKCAGCGAKVGAGTLVKLLQGMPTQYDPDLLVGFDTSDDACIYRIDEHTAIVQTLDFFPPIVDDPYMFGQIAACNALSDIYAMGGEPKLALNIMTVTKDMPEAAIRDILRGGYEKAYEAGAIICGGHTIHDESPKYGLSVTGFVDPHAYYSNASACPGDVLLLTKPLGIGILTTAARARLVTDSTFARITAQMATLNKAAAAVLRNYTVHSCTDVTGFGLMGHGYEMAAGSGTSIHITTDTLKYHHEALEAAAMGFVPDGAYKNRDYVADNYKAKQPVERAVLDILFDPQTSGGLLAAVPEAEAGAALEALSKVCDACIAGYVTEADSYAIYVE